MVGHRAGLARPVPAAAGGDRSPVVVGEPFRATLIRGTIFAAAAGAVLLVTLPRHGGLASDFVDAFTLAFCFAFLGHYVELAALALPDIETGVGRLVRVAVWFAAGCGATWWRASCGSSTAATSTSYPRSSGAASCSSRSSSWSTRCCMRGGGPVSTVDSHKL